MSSPQESVAGNSRPKHEIIDSRRHDPLLSEAEVHLKKRNTISTDNLKEFSEAPPPKRMKKVDNDSKLIDNINQEIETLLSQLEGLVAEKLNEINDKLARLPETDSRVIQLREKVKIAAVQTIEKQLQLVLKDVVEVQSDLTTQIIDDKRDQKAVNLNIAIDKVENVIKVTGFAADKTFENVEEKTKNCLEILKPKMVENEKVVAALTDAKNLCNGLTAEQQEETILYDNVQAELNKKAAALVIHDARRHEIENFIKDLKIDVPASISNIDTVPKESLPRRLELLEKYETNITGMFARHTKMNSTYLDIDMQNGLIDIQNKLNAELGHLRKAKETILDYSSLRGDVIYHDNKITVVLPHGPIIKNHVLIFKNHVKVDEHEPIDTNEKRLKYFPVGTKLKNIQWTKIDTKEISQFRCLYAVIGVIDSFQLEEQPKIEERMVICIENDEQFLVIADVKTNARKRIRKQFMSSNIGKCVGKYLLTLRITKLKNYMFNNNTKSWIPPATVTNVPTTTYTEDQDVVVDLVVAEGPHKLVLEKDEEKCWARVANVIKASSAVVAVIDKATINSAKITAKMQEYMDIGDTTEFKITFCEANEKKASTQKRFFAINSTALISCKSGATIKLKVTEATFTRAQNSISFKTNQKLLLKEEYAKDDGNLNGTTATITPCCYSEVYIKFADQILSKNLPIFSKTATPQSRNIVAALLGLRIEKREGFRRLPRIPYLNQCTKQQRHALQSFHGLSTSGTVLLGPSGSGKTKTLADAAHLLIDSSNETASKTADEPASNEKVVATPILVTAKANKAGFAFCEKAEEYCSDILLIPANSAMTNATEKEKGFIQKYGISKRLEEALEKPGLDEDEKKQLLDMQSYVQNYDDILSTNASCNTDETIFGEKVAAMNKCIKLMIKIHQPKIIISTLSIASRYSASLSEYIRYVLLDEAGLVPAIQLAAFIAQLPKLVGIFMAGDTCQLDGFPMSMSDWMKNFGYKSSLATVQSLTCRGFPSIFLDLNYRFDPAMVQVISKCCYKMKLLAGNSETTEDLFEAVFNIFAPNRMVFVDCPGKEEQCYPYSKRNIQHAYEALDMAIKLKQKYGDKSIAILTPYDKQKEFIEKAAKKRGYDNIIVDLIDASQSTEYDIVIVCLVISEEGKHPFLNDGGRFTVATTRARLLAIFVGNKKVMSSLSRWSQLLDLLPTIKATNKDVAVSKFT